MNISSSVKPVCPFDDVLPPAFQDPVIQENEVEPDSSVRAYVGQQLEFWSKTACRWIPCEVINVRSDLAIMVNVKPNTWLTLEDQAKRIRAFQLHKSPDFSPTKKSLEEVNDLDDLTNRPQRKGFHVGQPVEYLSVSAGRWIPSRVTHIDPESSIQLDVKPGCWIPIQHQQGHVRVPVLEADEARQPSEASLLAAHGLTDLQGAELEYYSLNLSAWIPCRIVQQDAQSGCVVIDVLPSAWITPAQQATYLRAPAPAHDRLRVPLIGDKVVYFSESHTRWILTIITDVSDADEVELEIKPGVWISRDVQKRILRWCSSQL